MNDDAIYLYGLVALPLARHALDSLEAAGVRLVGREDVACVVSEVRGSDYELPAAGSAADHLNWITPRAWRHHEVLRCLQAAATVLPFKFGMLCPDVDAVNSLLARVSDAARLRLADFEGKDEWTLEMSLDADVLARDLEATDPQLLALNGEAAALPDGRAYFVRKRRERLAAELLASRLATVERHACERITGDGVQIAPSSHRPERAQGQPVTLARTPLLVSRSSFPHLEERLASLEAEHASVRLRFALSGPLPPYTFATGFDLSERRHR